METMILKLKRPWRVALTYLFMTLASSGAGNAQDQNQAAAPDNAGLKATEPATAAEAFERRGVFVAPDMTGLANSAQLEAAVKKAGVSVKVAVVGALPPGSATVADLARNLHGQLKLQQGLMIVVCNRPRSLGLFGGGLNQQAISDIAARTAKTFDSEGYVSGVTRVMSLVREENGRNAATARIVIVFAVGVPAALMFWLWKRFRRARGLAASAARTVAEGEQAMLRNSADSLAHELSEAIALETDAGHRGLLHGALDSAQAALATFKRPLREAGTAHEWDALRAQWRTTNEQLKRSQVVLAQARLKRETNNAKVQEIGTVGVTVPAIPGGQTSEAEDPNEAPVRESKESPYAEVTSAEVTSAEVACAEPATTESVSAAESSDKAAYQQADEPTGDADYVKTE